MALVKGRFVDKTIPIQSDSDPIDAKDLARKGYVDQKAADEAAAKIEDAIADGVTDKAPSQNAVYDALALKLDQASKGVANGVAELDGSGKVPSAQLPSYVDDVIESADFASLPETGESGKIYVTLDDNKSYRWSGSTYVEISASPGSTDEVAEGALNLYFTDERAQLALASALSGKADLVHTHVAADLLTSTLLLTDWLMSFLQM
jgi:hypothetical protein